MMHTTPRPWRVGGTYNLSRDYQIQQASDFGGVVCELNCKGDAALIVQAVNAHERAVNLAKAVVKTYGSEVTAPLYEKARALLAELKGKDGAA